MRLNRRLLIFTALLGLLHAYIVWRLLPDLGTTARHAGSVVLLASFVLMMSAVLAWTRRPRSRTAERLIAPGLFMAGFFSSMLVLTLLRDILLLFGILALSERHVYLVRGASANTVAVLAVFATLAGFASARRRARIVHVDVPIANLPAALHGFSIAQISDIHVGSAIRKRYVDAIVDAVNGLRPDLIAVTGDVVDGPVSELAAHTAPLGRLSARHGAFFVTGNHEYYSGEPAWTEEFRRLGLKVLLNEHAVVSHEGARLVIAGVTDFSSHRFNPDQKSDPLAALAGAPGNAGAKILLAHQPRSAPAAAAAGYDLQLSGHTHGGQFWPWNLFVRFQQPFTAGLHRLKNLWVYVSRGTGYWGPTNRFGAPSEITRLRLVPA
jgi:uncharacterized protein